MHILNLSTVEIIEILVLFLASLMGCLFKEFFLYRHMALNKSLFYEYFYIPLLGTVLGMALFFEIKVFRNKIISCSLVTWIFSIFIGSLLHHLSKIHSISELIANIILAIRLGRSLIDKDLERLEDEQEPPKK